MSAPTTAGQDRRAPRAGERRPAAAALEVRDLTRTYGEGETRVLAVDRVSLSVPHGQFAAIMGASGSGKSTLLHCMAGLDVPTSGTVLVNGRDLTGMTDRDLTAVRRDEVGFIFQAFNLLPALTAEENITLPSRLAGRTVDPSWFTAVVDTLGIGPRLGHRPSELSGGQQQRVAVARALASRPAVVLADEPTGALDTESASALLEILASTCRVMGQTVVMVTHDAQAAAASDRIVTLRNGRVVSDHPTAAATDARRL